jgi:hypothetical protein
MVQEKPGQHSVEYMPLSEVEPLVEAAKRVFAKRGSGSPYLEALDDLRAALKPFEDPQ